MFACSPTTERSGGDFLQWLRKREWNEDAVDPDTIVSADVCPFCGQALVQSVQHYWYCPQCGHMANSAPLEDHAEWRAGMTQFGYDVGNGIDRCGAVAHPLFPTFGDEGGYLRAPPMLRSALQQLHQQGSRMQASGILVDRASFWLRQLKEQYPQARLTVHALTSACLWVAAREYNQMLSIEPSLDHPKILRSVSMLDQFRLTFQPSAMDEHHPVARATSTAPLRMVTPLVLLDQWLNDLPGFTAEGRRLALFIAMRIERYKLIVDHLPPAIAASILWFVCYQLDEPRTLTKPMLASYAKVTVVTMNMCLRKMELKRRWFFPDRFFAFRARRTYHATARPLVMAAIQRSAIHPSSEVTSSRHNSLDH